MLARTFRFASFTLLEYFRSARIVVEILATIIVWFIFMRRVGQGIDAAYFFTVAGIFAPLLALYTTSVLTGLGDRPQGYVVLVRRLSRTNYLLGLFCATLTIVLGAYGLFCIATALLNRPPDLTIGGWFQGTLPLALNVTLLTALVMMLSPLVFPTNWRLFVLTLIALAFSSNFITGPVLEALPDWLRALLRAMQTILGGPLVPAFYGYQIAITRDYSDPTVYANLLAQLFLALALVGLSIYAFKRRDLIFSN